MPLCFFQFGKSFGSQLHAKDDTLRDEAVAAMAALAKQVMSGLEGLLSHSKARDVKLRPNDTQAFLFQPFFWLLYRARFNFSVPTLRPSRRC